MTENGKHARTRLLRLEGSDMADRPRSCRILFLAVLVRINSTPCHPHSTGEQAQYTAGETEYPLGRWVHVGCEVSSGLLLLHIDGNIVIEKLLSSSDSGSGTLKKVFLRGANDNLVDGYICNMEILFSTMLIKEQYVKEPPHQLSIDFQCTSDVDEDGEGIWNIVGGKPTGRRTFTVDVVLLDAFGHPAMSNDIEVVASLLYADNGAPVETPFDAEAALLTSCDGVEFASGDKLIKLQNGHASFNLKMSQLSSKCDNRLFRIKFFIPNSGSYPFFETYSPPIRSVSRSRNSRILTRISKKSSSVVHANGSQSPRTDDVCLKIPQHAAHGAVAFKPTKRVKCLEGKSSMIIQHHPVRGGSDEEVHSPAKFDSQVTDASRTLTGEPSRLNETDVSQSDSESTEEESLESKGMSGRWKRFTDPCVFKYCLGGLEERANILKELALSASDQDLKEFAQKVSMYSGCSHHLTQIAITKKLIGQGTRFWNMMSQQNEPVCWENVVFEIRKQFMKIARTTRSLSDQDLSFLRRVSGCQGYVAQENFEKMWSWLYPVAYTLSRSGINSLWDSTLPNWIEGFITKEEAELSLQGSRGLQQPGTFILRFPTSRSWPHPDAGNLVVTYVGSDCTLHHRLISLDHMYSSSGDKNANSLQDMILSEPELSQLGRVIRSQ
uniref:SH2 domain-containing protein n=1 Tax=Kalanchoe fedtschenkoi TaxID=63787 RepID=A0A7N0VN92_KALFE